MSSKEQQTVLWPEWSKQTWLLLLRLVGIARGDLDPERFNVQRDDFPLHGNIPCIWDIYVGDQRTWVTDVLPEQVMAEAESAFIFYSGYGYTPTVESHQLIERLIMGPFEQIPDAALQALAVEYPHVLLPETDHRVVTIVLQELSSWRMEDTLQYIHDWGRIGVSALLFYDETATIPMIQDHVLDQVLARQDCDDLLLHNMGSRLTLDIVYRVADHGNPKMLPFLDAIVNGVHHRMNRGLLLATIRNQ